jgi:hypothetical protein
MMTICRRIIIGIQPRNNPDQEGKPAYFRTVQANGMIYADIFGLAVSFRSYGAMVLPPYLGSDRLSTQDGWPAE